MALIQTIPTPYGVDAAYWKAALTNINWLTCDAHVEMVGYPSEEARRAGAAPIALRAFDWRGPEQFPFTTGGNVQAEAYAAIKAYETYDGDSGAAQPSEFADAIDG
jgi:hypothetical protein